ncbi:unnamed protein product [Polarella glacialis]|uniref:RNA helicase n=1 Tax=Polarella glacialis TaxID=89957 RepID=A0A813KNW6_POLGL|nr:unnamed protein product [Polarella glacialis]
MDKAKGKGKSTTMSGAEAHIARENARNAPGGLSANGTQLSIWECPGDPPSYVHGMFCLTRDDHLEQQALPSFPSGSSGMVKLPSSVAESATDHLRELGLVGEKVKAALEVVAPRLLQEAEDRGSSVSGRAAAERCLEWICSTTAESALPGKLHEPREVTAGRKLQEDRNVACQTKSLLLGGQIDPIDITRIEKLGFSRARAIQALAEAANNELLPAVKSLLSEYLPLELPPDVDPRTVIPANPQELWDEVEAMQSIYGEEEVQSFGQGVDGMELMAVLPASGIGGGGGRWTLAFLIPPGLPYPLVSPLLCPRHERLREANRPRLMEALGDVCRHTIGSPMFFILCEWLQENGHRFLVRTATTSEESGDIKQKQLLSRQRDLAAWGAADQTQLEAEKAKQSAAEGAKRIEVLRGKMLEEGALKPKDKIAAEIRGQPETTQFDLSGYDDQQVQQLVKEAFGMPLDCKAMIRITFVVGGGKALRSKYSESLAKTLGSALQEHGFLQDSAASCDLASAGCFKGQHDTQRNQKLVHVFPKVSGESSEQPGARPSSESASQWQVRLAGVPWADFVEELGPLMSVQAQRQRGEALLSCMKDVAEEIQDTDKALLLGQQISEARRRRYDEHTGGWEELKERMRWLTAALGSDGPAPALRGNGAAKGVGPDGATLSFDAPDLRMLEAARLAKEASPKGDVAEDTDEAWLKHESEKMRAEFGAEKPLRKIRESLPAFSLREAIQQGVRNSQVILIEGDTGCGKSTQVPQFIMEDWVAKGEGGAVNLIMTQPRRISAIGVAERIANEMNTGIGDLVGYSIRLESKRSARTKILVCTTGVLLRRLESDRELRGVTHIVVDECHERDLDTDFLLIILRDLLPTRPNLRIILMSATINAQIFRDYFLGCGSFHIPGRTFPVTSYYLEHALQHTNFVIEPHSEFCRKDVEPWLSHEEEEELRLQYEKPEYQELLGGPVPSHVLKQLHRVDPEKINFELVAAVVRHIHSQVDPPTGNKTPGAILVFVPGLSEIKKTVRMLSEDAWVKGGKGKSSKGWDEGKGESGKGGNWGKGSAGAGAGGPEITKEGLWVLPLHSMISVNDQRLVFKRPPPGARKVVVTTNIAETSITIDDVEYVVDCGRHKQTKYDPQNRVSMLVDCVETKANAKQRRGRAGRVKAGVCYHLLNVRKWRRMDDFEKPEMLRVPLDSLCLRVSLMGMGHPAKVLAKAITPPSDAAVLSSLQQLVELSAVELREKFQGPAGTEGASPDAAEREIGADGWDKDDQQRLLKAKLRLTPLGNHLAQLPVDAGCGKLLVLGCIFGVPRDVCTVAAALSMKSPFSVNAGVGKGGGKGETDKRKLELAADLESDQLLLVRLFERWEKLGKNSPAARTWCRENSLDSHTFETISEMRKHLLGTLVEQGFATYEQTEYTKLMPACLSSIASATEEFDRRRFQLLRTLLCAALWPNVMLRKDNGTCYARNQASLAFHPSSVLALQSDAASQDASGDWSCPQCQFFNFATREECRSCWGPRPLPGQKKKGKALRHRAFMYGEKVRSLANRPGQKSETLCRDCCGVPLKALYLLGHRVQVDFLHGRMSLDGWIHCQAAPRDASMLLGLRRRLQDVLTRRLAKSTLYSQGAGLVIFLF